MAKREIVRVLEKVRQDHLAAITMPCWRCEGELDRITGCEECSGTGVIAPEHGMYHMAVAWPLMGYVVDVAFELVSDTADPDLRAALRWARNYKIEAMAAVLSDGDVLKGLEKARDQAAKLQGRPSEHLNLLIDRIRELGPSPTKGEIKAALRRFRGEEGGLNG